MNKQTKDVELNLMSKNSPSTQMNMEQDQNIDPSIAGIQPKTVKLVRPFAEAEARERERIQSKKEAKAKAEEEARLKAEIESKPKIVKMVRPFADAEAREKKENSIKLLKEQEKKEKAMTSEKTNVASASFNKPVVKSPTPEKPIIIPDQLNITIRTSIPGYQKIEYKPSMTIKDSDSKGVQFNPLIKLNKSRIDTIPIEYRTKQFLDKGLFQSLLNYNGGTPAKSLLQATRSGYIDNNIKVTLDELFPVNSVIYIGKQPYAIGDIQWTNGDWKVEVKQKNEELDPSKITDPILYTQLVREEIISGEEQLKQLPESLVAGNNYSGPQVDVAKGINSEPIKPLTPVLTTTSINPYSSSSTSNALVSNPYMPNKVAVPQTKEITNVEQPAQQLIKTDVVAKIERQPQGETVSPKQLLTILPPPPTTNEIEELSPAEEKLFESLKGSYSINKINTYEFTNYFLRNVYYSISNIIYLNMPYALRSQITNYYKLVTQPKVERDGKNLSRSMYDKLCKQALIIKSVSNGNCFFDAVAYGINSYNYKNQSNKFYYQNYGKTQLFTIAILREIVLRHYDSLPELEKSRLNEIGLANVNILNNEFAKSVQMYPVNNETDYLERINIIYKKNENFLVYKPTTRPIDINEDMSPFKLVTRGQVGHYIKSNDYWGDQFAIQAICNILNIYIIPIESKGYKNNLFLSAALNEPDTIKNICSKNVMFLYKKNLHYELIKFLFKEQKTVKKDIVSKIITLEKSYTIFKANNLPPPFHILILIYGSSYVTADYLMRKNFNVYSEYLSSINNSVKKIYLNKELVNSEIFIKAFTTLFNLNKPLDAYIKKQEYEEDTNQQNALALENPNTFNENMSGGNTYNANQSTNMPRPVYRYTPQYNINNLIKKQSEISKIAYAITIDMELHQGTSLTPEQISESKCKSRYNSIRKAFSEFTGRPYIIQPVYQSSQTKKNVGGKQNRFTRKNVKFL